MPENETQTPENTSTEPAQDTTQTEQAQDPEQNIAPESEIPQVPVKAKGKKSALILPDSETQEEQLPEVEYPSLVYVCPGQHSAKGATFDFVAIENDEQLKQRLDEGYSVSLPEAIKKFNG